VSQKVVKAGAVDRLTDASKFTGSHKERFTDDGKGRGVAGRKDVAENVGYVTGFKGASSSSSRAPSSGGSKGSSRPQSTSSDSGVQIASPDGEQQASAAAAACNHEPVNADIGHKEPQRQQLSEKEEQPVVAENATK